MIVYENIFLNLSIGIYFTFYDLGTKKRPYIFYGKYYCVKKLYEHVS